ncbi:tetratricopeptide repeat protein [Streptomyces sp. NPDC048290]|uniref:tetratricopeptide repeat protein n=1 Tax=Streptomyces sp. NPDC048290 TaxID=3155811 RepID=UPI003435B340
MRGGLRSARVAEVWSRAPAPGTGGYRVGSGYLIGDRTILTAAHVVVDTDGTAAPRQEIRLRVGGHRALLDGVVRWWRLDRSVDAALIEITDPHGRRLTRARPVRWGFLTGQRPAVGCEAIGFPYAVRRPDGGVREPEHIRAAVDAQSLAKSRTYRVDVLGSVPAPDGDPGHLDPVPWSGMSGAALLADDLVLGLCVQEASGFAHRRLIATRAETLAEDPEFTAAVATATGRPPVLEPVELAGLLAPATPAEPPRSPAGLLRAEHAVVPFHGRQRELAELRTWCDGPAPLDLRLLTGQGGQGKTRLALRLAAGLRARGWTCGVVSDGLRPPLLPDTTALAAVASTTRPLLIVVDYAEIRGELIHTLVDHAAPDTRIRLLLLARAAGDWWDATRRASPRLADLPAGRRTVHPLGALATGERQRRDLFTDAATGLAGQLSRLDWLPPADWTRLAHTLPPPPDVSHERYDSVLALHMAALAALLQAGPVQVETEDGDGPEDVLLAHEERYWRHSVTAAPYRLPLPGRTLATLVATATLCGAQDEREAVETLTGLDDLAPLSDAERHRAAAWLSDLYPGDSHWGSLQPDRLGEHHIARQSDREPALLDRALSRAEPHQALRALLVLARAARHAPALASRLRTTVVSRPDALGPLAVEAATRTGHPAPLVATVHTLATDETLGLDTVARLYQALPAMTRALADDAVDLARRLVDAVGYPPGTDDPERATRRAVALNNLANRLGAVGRHHEAVPLMEEAVEIRRGLCATDPDTHETDLARHLINLSNRLAYVGRTARAFETAEDAVRILRRRAATDPDALRPVLAMALPAVVDRHMRLGRLDTAAAAAREAVDLYRALSADDPDTYDSELALALNNQANVLGELGRHEEALDAAAESLRLTRRLAEDRPDAYLPDLGICLNNIALRHAVLGRPAQAAEAGREAVAIRRALAEAHPERHLPYVATSLNGLACDLADSGQDEEALEAAAEAARIYGTLAADDPTAHEGDFAMASHTLAQRLRSLGRLAESVEHSIRAVDIRRRLERSSPGAYTAQLAKALHGLGASLAPLGRTDEAASALAESVTAWRTLAATSGTRPVSPAELADAATDWAELLLTTGRAEAATALEIARGAAMDSGDTARIARVEALG